ncbi:MAG: enoyl-CoA hydratase/isomerase family protein [Marinibacterium sp.]|nr:enoyl-CoA hydratase/isomerase family protein [Marinibacterium sp.]
MTDQSSLPLVHEELDGPVAILSLGAMPAHPLSLAMIRALQASLDRCADNPDIRVVVLHGPGHIFCAGHDLKEIARHRSEPDHGLAYLRTLFEECGRMMQSIVELPKPAIAMVEGIATAGGLQMMASCDVTFATPQATFSLPGVQNGGFCTTPSVAVGRVIGRNALMEMALSGEVFDADWAQMNGLINRIVPAEDVRDVTLAFAHKVASGNPNALATGKRAFYSQMEQPLAQAYETATEVMIDHFMDPARIAIEQATWARK